MQKQTIYIAGKVSGLPYTTVERKFATAANYCREQGFEPINPIEEVNDENAEWNAAMRICIRSLMTADAIMLLPCWVDSPGAILEYKLAARLGMPMYDWQLQPMYPPAVAPLIV